MARFRVTSVTGYSVGGTIKQTTSYQVIDSGNMYSIVGEWTSDGGVPDRWRHDTADACAAALNEWDRTGDPELLKAARLLSETHRPGCVGCGCPIDEYTDGCKRCNARKRGRGLLALLPRSLGRDKRGRFT